MLRRRKLTSPRMRFIAWWPEVTTAKSNFNLVATNCRTAFRRTVRIKRTSVILFALMSLALSIIPRVGAQATASSVCGETIFALTANNRLISFSSSQPGTLLSNVAISGLQPGESLIGIDFRPKNRLLYGVTNKSSIYTIDPATGAAACRASPGVTRITSPVPTKIPRFET